MRRSLIPHAMIGGLLACFALPAMAQDKPTAAQLSKNLDTMLRSDSSKGQMTMQVTTPNYERSLSMHVTTRGMDDTLIRIVAPRKEKGISTLKKGKEMWNFLPKVKKTIKVPPSMMMGNWMGSDFTNDDLVKGSSWEADYTYEFTTDGAKADELCLKYTPKAEAAVTWSRVLACFDANSHLAKRLEFYDEKDRKARTMTYSDVKEISGRKIPTLITLIPHLKEGHKTSMRYDSLEFGVELKDNTFSMTSLRRAK